MLHSNLIGNKIATARKKANLSQSELAQQIAISPQAVGKWERGESMPDITTLNNLAKIFGVDLNYFSENFSTTEINPKEKQPLENLGAEIKKRFDWNWDMSQGNWVDADFSGLKGLKDKFSSSNIKKCKFIKSDLSGLTLKGNRITDCDFSQSDIRNGKINTSEISKSTFKETSLIDAEVQQSEIKNCNFDKSNLSGAEFINSNFQKNSIESAVLKHTSFKNTGLSEITFGGNIEDCSFENCSFKGVKFENATILNTFFKHNRKFNKVELIDCKVDKLTFAFLKSNGAKLEGITIIE
ncbi:pentapeptide repeat-containing protein [Echinicola sp. CAU 1574]|uniref:Pentapeptide repeat-containing protein n=1 Tax=Echinicola arenosa TaxID=2774144 RepID=A0ABR9APM3_9BACT|nr:pentapeptide repeat-containing protein [Echinicola arenosa]MBD8490748.1 pentapeptide repeat-containing protein [Echinicola arenosa]